MNGCITTELPEDKTQLLQEIADYRVASAVEETSLQGKPAFPSGRFQIHHRPV